MFLDIFPEGAADGAGIKSGELLCELNGVPSEPPEVPSFEAGQKHLLRVGDLESDVIRDVELAVPFRKAKRNRPPIVEPKSITVDFIAPSTGILKIPYFSGSLGLKFGDELRIAVEKLKALGTNRLIVDLRGNIGGSLGFATLASYMCPDQRPIGYSITSKTLKSGVDRSDLPQVPMPLDRTSLAWTLGRFLLRDKSVVLLTHGFGPQPFHGKIMVLVNEWTNSAGEMVASFASENALATVVGTHTAGNVLGASNFNVGSGYWVRLPVFGWLTWNGICLEGQGVRPEINIDKNPFGMGSESAEETACMIKGLETLEAEKFRIEQLKSLRDSLHIDPALLS